MLQLFSIKSLYSPITYNRCTNLQICIYSKDVLIVCLVDDLVSICCIRSVRNWKNNSKSLPEYDGRKSMFTAGSLPFTSKDFVIKLDEKNEGGSAASGSVGCVFVNILLFYWCLLLICTNMLWVADYLFYHRKKREREFKVTIRLAAKTDLHNLNQFLRRLQLECPQETIQALDVVLRATASEQ